MIKAIMAPTLTISVSMCYSFTQPVGYMLIEQSNDLKKVQKLFLIGIPKYFYWTEDKMLFYLAHANLHCSGSLI